MTNNFEKIVHYLIDKKHFNTLNISKELSILHDQVLEVIILLQSIGDYLITTENREENWKLTLLGKSFIENYEKQLDENKNNINLKKKEIDIDTYLNLEIIKNDGKLDDNEKLLLYEFKKFIEKSSIKFIEGKVFNEDSLNNLKYVYNIDEDLLKDERWKSAKILPYNFNKMGQKIQVGHLHFITEIMQNIRQILFEIGFTEQLSKDFIENPFWINDIPFVSNLNPEENIFTVNTKLKNTNESFNKVSTINKELTNELTNINKIKPIIRNSLNNTISRLLVEAKNKTNFPITQFVIGNVIGNGNTDELHLAEYHLLKLLIVDTQLNFGNIIGLLEAIFKRLHIENVEYKPAYSLFTEPTLETICYHYGLDQWIKIGKSGIIRQEILKTMNLRDNLIALVLSINLERIAMVKKDAMDIHEIL